MWYVDNFRWDATRLSWRVSETNDQPRSQSHPGDYFERYVKLACMFFGTWEKHRATGSPLTENVAVTSEAPVNLRGRKMEASSRMKRKSPPPGAPSFHLKQVDNDAESKGRSGHRFQPLRLWHVVATKWLQYDVKQMRQTRVHFEIQDEQTAKGVFASTFEPNRTLWFCDLRCCLIAASSSKGGSTLRYRPRAKEWMLYRDLFVQLLSDPNMATAQTWHGLSLTLHVGVSLSVASRRGLPGLLCGYGPAHADIYNF